MNKTKIDWTDMSWNPVTGCLHDCTYCYAKGITHRFGSPENANGELHVLDIAEIRKGKDGAYVANPYPFGFDPTFHKYRLEQPAHTKVPQRIFVGSMTDLFGEWVPDEWIMQVFSACQRAIGHTYMFLTKNPARYWKLFDDGKLLLYDDIWYGSTITGAEKSLTYVTGLRVNTFLSIEPIMNKVEIPEESLAEINWVIIGAETGSGKKVVPERSWIENIVAACNAARVPVFMKSNLEEVWGEPLIQELPH